jgi:hypothetical protein
MSFLRLRCIFRVLVLLVAAGRWGVAAEPFLKPHDVIAFVGGEDMVAMSEYGYLELLLVRALPEYQLRFRSLAWEGDTVFEQRRDLNFPPLEEQLDKIGATVVIAQFGQMESLAGRDKLPEFIAAYEKLVERLGQAGKRRVVIVGPTPSEPAPSLGSAVLRAIAPRDGTQIGDWEAGCKEVAEATSSRFVSARFILHWGLVSEVGEQAGHPWTSPVPADTRDGLHLSDAGQRSFARAIGGPLDERAQETVRSLGVGSKLVESAAFLPILTAIRAKNRLWFHYWRPQNWAFLNGDRINQPSSRDHLDPSKRWFPAEIEEFVPLIEAKEKEIDALAVKLAKP